MFDTTSSLYPPAPRPRARALGAVALFRALASNPLEAWTEAHFNEPIVLGGLPFSRVAVVSDPQAIRHVLLDNGQNYRKDWLQRRVLSAGLTGGLLTAEDGQWRTQRRALAPLFARRTVMGFAAVMRAAADGLVARLDAQAGQVIEVAVEITRTTLDVLERTIFSDGFGSDREAMRRSMQRYFEAVGRIDPFDLLGLPQMTPRRSRLKAELRFFEAAIDTVIARRERLLAQAGESAPADILTLLLRARDPESGARLSEAEVRANILTFIAAGHETTANCLAWSLFLLSQSPDWCERLAEEAARELDGDIDGLADRLVATRAVIEESNRLYPPLAAISRSAMASDTLGSVGIKRGTLVVIAPYVLHRHRALWADPDGFDPARFLGVARERIDRFAYLPFGAGPRICVGAQFAMQEAAIVLATLMRRFRPVLAPGHAVWPVQKVTLRPRGGLPMLLMPRGRPAAGPRPAAAMADAR
ncbi:MAG TPA: cytochrome P450 [Pseudolabrys sp.]|jgi:cytochrome P450|nr:cytochrome P450 [Pseudolabrys sp.]